MQAIETIYNGYRFRSRLEARWATFFDAIDLDWEYEIEGFQVDDSEFYLPDFRIVNPFGLENWYEVKPKHIIFDSKFDKFDRYIRSDGYLPIVDTTQLLSGDPVDFFTSGGIICPCCGGMWKPEESVGGTMHVPEWWGGVVSGCSCDPEGWYEFCGPKLPFKKGKYLTYSFFS